MRPIQLIQLAGVYRIAMRMMPYLPPRLGYGACESLGWLGRYTPAWSRIVDNVAYVVPDASPTQREQYAREVVGGLLKNYYDLLRSHALSSADFERMTDVQGIENMQCALERGTGAITVMPHLGNFSLVAEPVALRLRCPITVVVERMANQAAHDLINTLRRRSNIAVVEVGPSVTRTLLRTLRRGEIVVLFGDRAVSEATVDIPFFGVHTAVPAGAATLALRTGVPLLTAYTYRQADHRSVVVIDPPLALHRSGTLTEDVQRATTAIMRVLAAYIRRYPGQWVLTERVWATP